MPNPIIPLGELIIWVEETTSAPAYTVAITEHSMGGRSTIKIATIVL
jgi:hypothetical protein